jgi:chromosome segregation ATPase
MREKKNFEDEKKKGGNVAGGSGISETDMKAKDAEIAYLEAQLRKKEEENVKLKKEIERVLQDQMKTLEKIKDADNAFMGNNENTELLSSQVAELKKENSMLQYQLNRAEREKQ